jgi:hypothetical protein
MAQRSRSAVSGIRHSIGDKAERVARLAVTLATTPEFRDHPKVADAASELLAEVFGAERASTRMVSGVTSLPKGVCVVVELTLATPP